MSKYVITKIRMNDRMKKLLYTGIILIYSVLTFGCAHNVSTGTNYVQIGEVNVTKELIYTGATVDDTLRVSADENGNARVTAGRGIIELIPFYLSASANTELSEFFSKMLLWGETSKNEKIETDKYLGSVSTNSGFSGGTVLMQLSFLSGPEGKNWAGKFNFCKLQSQAEMMFGSTRPIGSNPCVKEVYMYASPASILKFKEYLAMVPEYSTKAASSKSKSDLLK